ncbi:TlpA family protein disulfide reductase [Microbulbifer thermotolerans]|nr:TlpA disulfide reductase family protein [Microbulbifer thermotolerans]MCX2778874.1 TlpA family protein disulfide reductase [Microbulbifer thermotolerans]MCX2784316.1 TlpA family protein disulfide reductase [Microbulbifer thermotolerans]MCX2793760.1 TlpA family protein disulfide reductase [Microbulbifer thermotolerans]MCX2800943.1 TlpA family protein disulfide reductase [Microbulbifer thermotolerans]MCX2804179.1 TlpA family protein disulfide reductase [Microbulbifer thermotolerans]
MLSVDGEGLEPAGRVLLVNYWAEWCAPCREEIPALNTLAQSAETVLVVGINYDALPAEQTRTQMEKLGIVFPVLVEEPPYRWGQPRPDILPSTFVIDPDGQWRETLVGPQTLEQLKAAVERSRL